MMRTAAGLMIVWALSLPLAPAVSGQEPATGDAAAAIDTSSVLMREVFTYPRVDRRDPFEPLSAGADMGPQFRDLVLAGIIYSTDLGSVAILVDRTTKKRYRLWNGDAIGEARLIEVRPTEAVFTVTVFGVSREETLRVENQEKEQDG